MSGKTYDVLHAESSELREFLGDEELGLADGGQDDLADLLGDGGVVDLVLVITDHLLELEDLVLQELEKWVKKVLESRTCQFSRSKCQMRFRYENSKSLFFVFRSLRISFPFSFT